MERFIRGCIEIPHQLQRSFNFELNERIIALREIQRSVNDMTVAYLDTLSLFFLDRTQKNRGKYE
jgi:hypothetical protein